jgi:hypothetical protein
MTFKHVAPIFTMTRLEENTAYIYTRQKLWSYYQFPCDGTGWLKGNKTDYWMQERLIRPYIWKLDFIKWYVESSFNFNSHTRLYFCKAILCLVVLLVYSLPSDFVFFCQPFSPYSSFQFSLCSSILYCTDIFYQFCPHTCIVCFSLWRSLIFLKYLFFMPSSFTHVSYLRVQDL